MRIAHILLLLSSVLVGRSSIQAQTSIGSQIPDPKDMQQGPTISVPNLNSKEVNELCKGGYVKFAKDYELTSKFLGGKIDPKVTFALDGQTIQKIAALVAACRAMQANIITPAEFKQDLQSFFAFSKDLDTAARSAGKPEDPNKQSDPAVQAKQTGVELGHLFLDPAHPEALELRLNVFVKDMIRHYSCDCAELKGTESF